jgi:tryptophanyl-tRNA synthetase
MSKSDVNENAVVRILDSKDDIIRKFKRAVTDSGCEIIHGEGKEGISNLLTIYSCFTGKTIEEAEKEFAGKGYGDFKLAVGEACADALAPVRAEFDRLMKDKAYLEQIMAQGAENAFKNARRTMSKVKRKIGFTEIFRVVEKAYQKAAFIKNPTVEDIFETDREARNFVSERSGRN